MASPEQERPRGEITVCLQAWEQGDPAALDRLMPLLYDELRAIASRRLGPGDTLSTTELVHETYLQLCAQRRAHWEDRAQFFAVTARVMRRLLTDRSRRRDATKRGGGERALPLARVDAEPRAPTLRATDLDLALRDLGSARPDLAQVVELRFFTGLTNLEVADALQLSPATVDRRMRLARAWLCRHLGW
jgi:RNA polymerase sigma factor (TIGR02999 family)